MTAQEEFFLVAPENRRVGLHNSPGKHLMQIDHQVSSFVAHDDDDGAVLGLDSILDEGADAFIDSFLH